MYTQGKSTRKGASFKQKGVEPEGKRHKGIEAKAKRQKGIEEPKTLKAKPGIKNSELRNKN